MSAQFLLPLFVCLALWPSSMDAYNFCYGSAQKDLCRGNVHIVCDPVDVPTDGEVKLLQPMTRNLREFILKHHNEFRDKLASGTEKSATLSFPAAARMVALTWDEELAFTSRVHVVRCNMEHDKCHNTKRYPYSGQNLGYTTTTKDAIEANLLKLIKMWYDEKELVKSLDEMAKYSSATGHGIGHLTCMACERTSRVGCALAICFNGRKNVFHLTCNYENTNANGLPVYTASDKPASKCADWNTKVSEKYPNLCENTGTILDSAPMMKPSKANKGDKGAGGDAPANPPARRGMGKPLGGGSYRQPKHPQYPEANTVIPDIDVQPITSKDPDIHD